MSLITYRFGAEFKDKTTGLTEFIALFFPCKNMSVCVCVWLEGGGGVARSGWNRCAFRSAIVVQRQSDCQHVAIPTSGVWFATHYYGNRLCRVFPNGVYPFLECIPSCWSSSLFTWHTNYKSPDNLVGTAEEFSSISGRGIFLFYTASWPAPSPIHPHI
jgi:hypothetical protein